MGKIIVPIIHGRKRHKSIKASGFHNDMYLIDLIIPLLRFMQPTTFY